MCDGEFSDERTHREKFAMCALFVELWVYWDWDKKNHAYGVALDMKAYPLENFIWLGGLTRYLLAVKEGRKIHGEGFILNNIQSFLDFLDKLGLKTTRVASDELISMRDLLQAYPPKDGINAEHAEELRRIIEFVEHTLRAESATLRAYVLTEEKMDVARLVDRPDSFFGNKAYAKLPLVAQYDIVEAGKCIAFERPTAAAFHLLRATEDTLRKYFSVFFKKKKIENLTWGQLIMELRKKKRKPKPEKTLLDHLDNIRNNFRNPTDHPDMIYGIDEAQDLFALVVDVLKRLTNVLSQTQPRIDLKGLGGLRRFLPS